MEIQDKKAFVLEELQKLIQEIREAREALLLHIEMVMAILRWRLLIQSLENK